jgi:hypothetical protein
MQNLGLAYLFPFFFMLLSSDLATQLHVFHHGCGMSFKSGPGFNFTYVDYAGFNTWALLNDMVS